MDTRSNYLSSWFNPSLNVGSVFLRCNILKSSWMETSQADDLYSQSRWSLLPAAWQLAPQECKQLLPPFTAPSAGCGKFLPWCARLRWSATVRQMLRNTTQLPLKRMAHVRQRIICTCFKNVTTFNWCHKYLWLESASCTALLHVPRLPWKEFPLEFKK